MKFLISGFVLIVSLLLIAGCYPKKSLSRRYLSNKDVRAQTQPYSNAYLLLGGATIETDVAVKNAPGAVEFTFLSNDTLLDSERYSFTDTSFDYAGNENETFEPGVTLLRFPFDVGDTWSWSGTYGFGGKDRNATAQVTTAEEALNLVIGQYATIKVTVDLSIDSGMQTPATQKLIFWIAPKKGVVQRDFLYGGSREPMPPQSDSTER